MQYTQIYIRYAYYSILNISILLTKITAPQNEAALSYYRVRGLYFLAVIFEAAIML